MIQRFKDDPILQVSSQEPSASSKYDFEDEGVLEALLNMIRELRFGTQVKNHISGRSMMANDVEKWAEGL